MKKESARKKIIGKRVSYASNLGKLIHEKESDREKIIGKRVSYASNSGNLIQQNKF